MTIEDNAALDSSPKPNEDSRTLEEKLLRMKDLQQHPIGATYPAPSADDFSRMRADIQSRGSTINSIYLFEGKILDGYTRHRICLDLRIVPKYIDFDPATQGSPLEFVDSQNRSRRHLTSSQLAMRAADAAIAFENGRSDDDKGKSSAKGAAQHDTSIRSTESGMAVRRKGIPTLNALVNSGHVKVHVAEKIAALPKEQQEEVVSKGADGIQAFLKTQRVTATKAKAAPKSQPRWELHSGPEGANHDAEGAILIVPACAPTAEVLLSICRAAEGAAIFVSPMLARKLKGVATSDNDADDACLERTQSIAAEPKKKKAKKLAKKKRSGLKKDPLDL